MRILLVEDDHLLASGISTALTTEGNMVEWISDGDQAARIASDESFDCVILDWRLPGKDGLHILSEWRAKQFLPPVLMLTARGEIMDRVACLDAGADDYLQKPFSLEELKARIRALVRRERGHVSNIVQIGDLCLDLSQRQVKINHRLLSLSPQPFNLLADLMLHAGSIRTREQLVALLYGWDGGGDSNTLEVCIHHLRSKIGKNAIRTIRGVGYLMDH